MERLLEGLRKRADQAEVFGLDRQSDFVRFENGRLKSITSDIQSGVSVRLVRQGRLGFAYTKNLLDPDGLIRHAESSLADALPPGFGFPPAGRFPALNNYDPAVEDVAGPDLVGECDRILTRLRGRTRAQINLAAVREVQTIRVMNTAGLNAETRLSSCFIHVNLLFPGSYASIDRGTYGRTLVPMPDADLDFIVELYGQAQPDAAPAGGPMPAIFLPDVLYVLLWRLRQAASGRSVHLGESRLAGRLGQAVFSPALTVYDDPQDDRFPTARAFDDEGSATARLVLIENGVPRSFFYDLEYAHRAGARPTGHGYRVSAWGGDPVSNKPEPELEHLFIAPGDTSIDRMIRTLDRGLIIGGALGAHSGNIPNGDFSIGLSPGLYVENGRIRGRIRNAMVAGNVYEVLGRIRSIGDALHPTHDGHLPALLVDQVNLSVQP